MRTPGRVVVVGSSIIKLHEGLKPDHALPNQLHRALRRELGATPLAIQLRDPERAQSGFVAESRNFFMRFADAGSSSGTSNLTLLLRNKLPVLPSCW